MISSAFKYKQAVDINRVFKWICLSTLFLLLLSFAFPLVGLSTSVTKNLLSCLTSIDQLPQENIFDAVYILGGNQESLKAKYETIAKLYAQGRCKEISILSRQGITEYNNTLGRNLTNDEWTLMIFEGLGVSQNDVRSLKIEPGFFGTYTEAKWVSKVAGKNGWKNLLLITSPHHTKRVKKSFNFFLNGINIDIWVAASKHDVGLLDLLSEFFKLKFYQIFLLC